MAEKTDLNAELEMESPKTEGKSITSTRRTFHKFVAACQDIEFYCLTNREQAKRLGVHEVSVARWHGKMDAEGLLRDHRAKYARHFPKIDLALIRRAQKGDVKAIELSYQRFEGWSQKHSVDISSHRENKFESLMNVDLICELVKPVPLEERQLLANKFLGIEYVPTGSAPERAGPGNGPEELPKTESVIDAETAIGKTDFKAGKGANVGELGDLMGIEIPNDGKTHQESEIPGPEAPSAPEPVNAPPAASQGPLEAPGPGNAGPEAQP